MAKGDEELTHDEIWDDSALVDSWNSALDEYKKYHSLQARGGTIQDLEEVVQSSVAKRARVTDESQRAEPTPQPAEAPKPAPTGVPVVSAPAPPPQALLGSMQDENLKKLLMSWYYAGYYTGLYEGQQHAQQKNQ